MNPVLLHLYGPLSIQIYGVCIAIGTTVSFLLAKRDVKIQTLISHQSLITCTQLLFLSAVFGARILHMLSNPEQCSISFLFQFWEPGLSSLGGIIACVITMITYISIKKIPLLPLLDRLSIYAPLVQAFGRIGCFFVGCCYGRPLNSFFAITYTHENNMAPLYCSLHPTQLYSSGLFFAIFALQYFIIQKYAHKPGLLLCSYLLLISTERFLIDFVRWDREFTTENSPFSVHQWIATSLFFTTLIFFLYLRNKKNDSTYQVQ